MGKSRLWSLGASAVAMLFFAVAFCPATATATGFGPSALSGPYVVQASGNTTDSSGHQGFLALSGIIDFNGSGAVTGIDLTVSAYDRPGDTENCVISGSTTAGLSFYAVNPDGTGTLGIGVPLSSCLNNSLTSNGSIQFNIAIPHARVGFTRLISNGTFSNLTDQGGDSITSLLLTGTLQHQ